MSAQTARQRSGRAATLVVGVGVTSALHIGKLPVAIPVLRDALGVTLLEAGFLLSLALVSLMVLLQGEPDFLRIPLNTTAAQFERLLSLQKVFSQACNQLAPEVSRTRARQKPMSTCEHSLISSKRVWLAGKQNPPSSI